MAPWCRQMQEFVHRKNLEHYRRLLAGDTLDDAGRAYVKTLLTEAAKVRLFPPAPPKDD